MACGIDASPVSVMEVTPVMYALIARVSNHGVADFRHTRTPSFPCSPLLAEHGGHLDRRVRSRDGTLEVHLLLFESDKSLDRFRADPRRVAANPMPEAASADLELIQVLSVPDAEPG